MRRLGHVELVNRRFSGTLIVACLALGLVWGPLVPADQLAPSDVPPIPLGERLPWERTPDLSEPTTPRLNGPRDLLALFDIDDSHLQQLLDGRPLVTDEEEILGKLLFRLPQFGRERLEAWQREPVWGEELQAALDDYRFQIVAVQGRARQVQRVTLPPEMALRLQFDHYFVVDLEVEQAAELVQVVCRDVPQAWQEHDTVDDPAAFLGLFLKTGEGTAGGSTVYFAAERVAWLPDRVDPQRGITAEHVLLGKLGMDAGLWDQVRKTNARRLLAADHEAFYQLLVAADRARGDRLADQPPQPLDLAAVLNQPQSQQGRLIRFDATARRVQKVLVEDESVQQRFGIRHYYQIDLLLPLGDQEVRLADHREQGETPVFRNTYPVHLCVLELPPGLPALPEVNQDVRVTGFYFKLWAYRTDYVQSFGPDRQQLGPLFIGPPPQVLVRQSTSHPVWGWLGGTAFLAVLGMIVLASWFYRRSDQQAEARIRRKYHNLDPHRSLDELVPDVPATPDFSHLESAASDRTALDEGFESEADG